MLKSKPQLSVCQWNNISTDCPSTNCISSVKTRLWTSCHEQLACCYHGGNDDCFWVAVTSTLSAMFCWAAQLYWEQVEKLQLCIQSPVQLFCTNKSENDSPICFNSSSFCNVHGKMMYETAYSVCTWDFEEVAKCFYSKQGTVVQSALCSVPT